MDLYAHKREQRTQKRRERQERRREARAQRAEAGHPSLRRRVGEDIAAEGLFWVLWTPFRLLGRALGHLFDGLF